MLKYAEFCAGIGGFRLGLEQLGWECVYACDIDEQCEKTYASNFGHKFDARDIFDVNPSKIPSFDILCAGFPCQPFSIAGKRLGFEDHRGTVLFKILSIIAASKPKFVLLENVSNFASHTFTASLNALKHQLELMDYNVYQEILDSGNFGVPQHRKRLYIVAVRGGNSGVRLTITKKRAGLIAFRNFIVHGDFSIPISAKWQEYIDLYTGKKTLDQMSFEVPKTRTALERCNQGVDLENCVLQLRSSGIRACSIDAPLPTFAVSHSGGGAMIPVYTKERRHLNLLEIKRIMGFPDEFKFPVARTHAIKQLSNAVCPQVITSIGQDIQTFLKLSAEAVTTAPVRNNHSNSANLPLQLTLENALTMPQE